MSLTCLLSVVNRHPLAVHVSLLNPADASDAELVPRVIAPLGVHVQMRVHDEVGREVYASPRSKAKPKLHPSQPESYLALEPGYSFGAILTVDSRDLRLGPGDHDIEILYDSSPFLGPAGSEDRRLQLSASVKGLNFGQFMSERSRTSPLSLPQNNLGGT